MDRELIKLTESPLRVLVDLFLVLLDLTKYFVTLSYKVEYEKVLKTKERTVETYFGGYFWKVGFGFNVVIDTHIRTHFT